MTQHHSVFVPISRNFSLFLLLFSNKVKFCRLIKSFYIKKVIFFWPWVYSSPPCGAVRGENKAQAVEASNFKSWRYFSCTKGITFINSRAYLARHSRIVPLHRPICIIFKNSGGFLRRQDYHASKNLCKAVLIVYVHWGQSDLPLNSVILLKNVAEHYCFIRVTYPLVKNIGQPLCVRISSLKCWR